MATRVRRRPTDGQGSKQVQNNGQRKATQRRDEPAPLIPVLARRVREVEARVSSKGKASPTNRTKFLVVALLMRSERARVREDTSIPSATRADLLKRLDGIATILAQVAARDTSLLTLLDANAKPGPAAQQMRRDWLLESGAELAEEDLVITAPEPPRARRPGPDRSPAGHAAVGPLARARQPVPHARPRPRPERLPSRPPRRLGPAQPALPRLRAGRRRRGRVDGPAADAADRPLLARPARSSWSTSRGSSRASRRATAPSCSPTSPASARRPSRSWPPRSRAPTRCSPSCRTS